MSADLFAESKNVKEKKAATTNFFSPEKRYKEKVLRELRTIPGVGQSISLDLWNLGIRSVGALKNKNPETLYRKLSVQAGQPLDRCLFVRFSLCRILCFTQTPQSQTAPLVALERYARNSTPVTSPQPRRMK